MAAQQSEAKRSGGKHFSISEIHKAALLRLVDDLKEAFPERKVNASSTLEWMIEKICGKNDEELAAYIKLRNEMSKLNNNKG